MRAVKEAEDGRRRNGGGPLFAVRRPSLFARGENEVLHKSGDFLGWPVLPPHAAVTVCAPRMINGREMHVCRTDIVQKADGFHIRQKQAHWKLDHRHITYVSNLPWDDALMMMIIILERSRGGNKKREKLPARLLDPRAKKKWGRARRTGAAAPEGKMDAISAVMSPGK